MKQRLVPYLVSALAVLALATPMAAQAFGARSGSNVGLPKNETNRGTLYIAGKNVTIDGDVDGDLVCAGSTITINGAIHGDVICAGQVLTVNGAVDGSIRAAAQTITMNGTVGRNVTVAGQTVALGTNGSVSGEMAVLGQTVNVSGSVGQELYGAMEDLALNAAVSGSVSARTSVINLGSAAHVGGDLNYTSPTTLELDRAKVSGSINHRLPEHPAPLSPRESFLVWLSQRLYWTLATLVAALALAALAPRAVNYLTRAMLNRPGMGILLGLAVMFGGPILLVLLLLTVVGVPLAFLLGGTWLLAVAAAGVFASLAVGRLILREIDWNRGSLVWAAVVGVPVLMVIFGLPVIGGLATLLAVWWALGGIALAVRALR